MFQFQFLSFKIFKIKLVVIDKNFLLNWHSSGELNDVHIMISIVNHGQIFRPRQPWLQID